MITCSLYSPLCSSFGASLCHRVLVRRICQRSLLLFWKSWLACWSKRLVRGLDWKSPFFDRWVARLYWWDYPKRSLNLRADAGCRTYRGSPPYRYCYWWLASFWQRWVKASLGAMSRPRSFIAEHQRYLGHKLHLSAYRWLDSRWSARDLHLLYPRYYSSSQVTASLWTTLKPFSCTCLRPFLR